MLLFSFVALLVINALQAWHAQQRHGRKGSQMTSKFERNPATRESPGCGARCCSSASASRSFLLLPLVAVFVEALRKGWATH